MDRVPEQCQYRSPLPRDDELDGFSCALVHRILGSPRIDAVPVSRDLCGRCCAYRLPSPTHLNPIIASLVYQSARRIAEHPAVSWLDRQEAARSQRFVLDQLELAHASGPDPPRPVDSADTVLERGPADYRLRLAVGMITAPRREPTIDRALQSLTQAGFTAIHIFAEPDSWIPRQFAYLPCTTHGRRLGSLGNFFTALVSLATIEPDADGYVIFEDDVVAARGLRAWCDAQFWPLGMGLASLYTCGVEHGQERGWRVMARGRYHTLGGLGFVFRREVLREFLSDGRVLEWSDSRGWGDDTAVGEWAARRGIGIAYHTPSLLGHLGDVSSIAADAHGNASPLCTTRAVTAVDAIGRWKPPPRSLGEVGLVGWNTVSGLGIINRDLATHLPIARWLAPEHPLYPAVTARRVAARVDTCRRDLSTAEIKDWLRGLDWVVFAETPGLPRLVHCARAMGIQVACVPMWECTKLSAEWMALCNLIICPTRFTYELYNDWKERFGFGWDTAYVPWPIDVRRFPFRRRTRCERFLFVNGNGGGPATREDGTSTEYGRKGLDIVIEAARLLRPIPFLVYSQQAIPAPGSGNVELRPALADNGRLYEEADICVQPSRWEGIGLALLECQASGMPLVTTDAPPMNEFRPIRAVPARRSEVVTIVERHVLTSHDIAPEDLAASLEALYRTDIGEASRAARSFIEDEHSWEKCSHRLIQAMAR